MADSLPQSFRAAREARAAFLERLIGEHAPGVAVPAAVMLAIGVGHHRGMTVCAAQQWLRVAVPEELREHEVIPEAKMTTWDLKGRESDAPAHPTPA